MAYPLRWTLRSRGRSLGPARRATYLP